jgi:hypothetical protein
MSSMFSAQLTTLWRRSASWLAGLNFNILLIQQNVSGELISESLCMTQYAPPIHWNPQARLDGVLTQKTIVWMGI